MGYWIYLLISYVFLQTDVEFVCFWVLWQVRVRSAGFLVSLFVEELLGLFSLNEVSLKTLLVKQNTFWKLSEIVQK